LAGSRLRFLALVPVLVSLFGCASARMADAESTRLFRDGKYEEAAEKLKDGLSAQLPNGRDQLLYLFDLGLALHSAGQLEESNKVLLEADKIAEIKDYTSLATETSTLLVGDNIGDYKGEDFENVLINTYLAMNYALIGDNENALVEARRVNRKLYLMVTEGQRKYQQNAFARYLSAVLYEADGNFGDAYIDYKQVRALDPTVPGLGRDLWRMASELRMRDEMENWDREYALTEADHQLARRTLPRAGNAEIIVLYENGISPEKRPNPDWRVLPRFYPRHNPVLFAEVELNGERMGPTFQLHNIEATAIRNLDEKYGGLIAKKVSGVIAKEVLADQIERKTNSPLLGFIARVAFYASDQADLRSWNLLPKDLQLARFVVTPGTYTVRLLPDGADALPEKTVQVTAGKKVFVNFRYMP